MRYCGVNYCILLSLKRERRHNKALSGGGGGRVGCTLGAIVRRWGRNLKLANDAAVAAAAAAAAAFW